VVLFLGALMVVRFGFLVFCSYFLFLPMKIIIQLELTCYGCIDFLVVFALCYGVFAFLFFSFWTTTIYFVSQFAGSVLWMELDIQRFLQNPDQQLFEFQHFPTSYLRLAAHRVAHHYGLITMVQDNGIDGLGNKILVQKTAQSRYPAVCLTAIPAKQLESDKPEKIKLAIRPRPNKGSINDPNGFGVKRSPVRSVEERKEDYDRARARIFSSPSSPTAEDTVPELPTDSKSLSSSKDENEESRNSVVDPEKNVFIRDSMSSRVAIFRDREKDRTDPDYDRSYDR